MPTTPIDPTLVSCRTCGVEYGSGHPEVCPICADERQYLPPGGQVWTTQADWARTTEVTITELSPGQWGVAAGGVGIGQTMQVLTTADGTVVWDPTGYADVETVDFLRGLGPVLAIVASHPHMYGCQVTWSRALGDAPVLVNERDADWVQRGDTAIQLWSGTVDLAPGVQLRTLGGHFPGSAVLHRAATAEAPGLLLSGDTIMANADRTSASFLRSYPNRIPLSAAVVERMAAAIADLRYDALWSNFGNAILGGADRLVQESAERHCGWVRGNYDDLT